MRISRSEKEYLKGYKKHRIEFIKTMMERDPEGSARMFDDLLMEHECRKRKR